MTTLAMNNVQQDMLQLALLQRSVGTIGTIEWIDNQLRELAKNESHASLDSELSLVRWDDYPRYRWQPNFLKASYGNTALADAFPTMMVARIDAPTLKLAKGLIDTAIEVEQQGLKGKVYFDARGLAKPDQRAAPGSYEDYDAAVLIGGRKSRGARQVGGRVERGPRAVPARRMPGRGFVLWMVQPRKVHRCVSVEAGGRCLPYGQQ